MFATTNKFLMKEKVITVQEQVEVALDGRTQRWLSLNARIPESELSKKMNGYLKFMEAEIARINEILKSSIVLTD